MSPRPQKKLNTVRARSASTSIKPRRDSGGESMRSPAINSARVAKSQTSHGQLVYATPRTGNNSSRGSTPVSCARHEVHEAKAKMQEDLRARIIQLEQKERASSERIRTLESLVLALAQSAPGFQLEYIGTRNGPGGREGSAAELLPRAVSASPSKASETLSIDRGKEGQVRSVFALCAAYMHIRARAMMRIAKLKAKISPSGALP